MEMEEMLIHVVLEAEVGVHHWRTGNGGVEVYASIAPYDYGLHVMMINDVEREREREREGRG